LPKLGPKAEDLKVVENESLQTSEPLKAEIPQSSSTPESTISPPAVAEVPNIEQRQDIAVPEEKKLENEGKIKISEHPNFAKYFKMLRLGIPELGVKQKMASEGFDASLLDKPDALIEAPSAEPKVDESDSDDSSFSSSSSGSD
jgi:hypothetical protein